MRSLPLRKCSPSPWQIDRCAPTLTHHRKCALAVRMRLGGDVQECYQAISWADAKRIGMYPGSAFSAPPTAILQRNTGTKIWNIMVAVGASHHMHFPKPDKSLDSSAPGTRLTITSAAKSRSMGLASCYRTTTPSFSSAEPVPKSQVLCRRRARLSRQGAIRG